jgi:hypothetical protein
MPRVYPNAARPIPVRNITPWRERRAARWHRRPNHDQAVARDPGRAGGRHDNVWSLNDVVHQAGDANGRIPGALVALVASIAVVSLAHLRRHGVAVLGTIHGGLPTFAMPSTTWADVRHLVNPALTIAFLVVAQTAASIRAVNPDATSPTDIDHDLIAEDAVAALS